MSGSPTKKNIVVAATGASGMPILKNVLELLRENGGYHILLILSDSAKLTIETELDIPVSDIEALADHVLPLNAIGATIASGSYPAEGMIIVPCSMKTVAGIATGYTDNLILRAADVTLKEKRPLVLATRETPLNSIHLRNMEELSRMQNVWIIPPVMSFYSKPKTIDEMVYHIAAKLVSPFGVQAPGYKRWEGVE